MTLWLPFTQMKQKQCLPLAVRGKGASLALADGKTVLDLVSSWWVTLHGHGQKEIAKAIYKQAKTLEHVLFADLQHAPAKLLIQCLQKHLPSSLSHFFFSDDGSTAIEVALKMAFQYWKNQKEERKKFLVFEGSYHGDTVGAMSLGKNSYFSVFQDLCFEVFSLPFPSTFEGDCKVSEKEERALFALEQLLEQEKGKIAAIFLEPLIQGASGMRMCREIFLQEVEKIVRKAGILLIYDEVMTGFGRTGEWFSLTKSSTCPDILCLAKGLTGGFLPLSLTICSSKIYEAFYSDDPTKTFYHGHSYTANPLGCAAAIASLALLEKKEAFRKIEIMHRKELSSFFENPKVEHVRLCGTIAAMDFVTQEKNFAQGKKMQALALEKGVYLRPLGNVLYLMPPYCITQKELTYAYEVIRECLQRL